MSRDQGCQRYYNTQNAPPLATEKELSSLKRQDWEMSPKDLYRAQSNWEYAFAEDRLSVGETGRCELRMPNLFFLNLPESKTGGWEGKDHKWQSLSSLVIGCEVISSHLPDYKALFIQPFCLHQGQVWLMKFNRNLSSTYARNCAGFCGNTNRPQSLSSRVLWFWWRLCSGNKEHMVGAPQRFVGASLHRVYLRKWGDWLPLLAKGLPK